jgi:predicted RNase H-like nuclease
VAILPAEPELPPRAAQPRYIGLDLAWGEGSAAKLANETGLAMIDGSGRVLHAGWARGLDQVIDWLLAVSLPGDIIAVDAPLVIPNPTGMRPCEREVGMRYGRWHVAANASNQAMGWTAGVTLRERLEPAGFAYTDGTTPPDPTVRTLFECYPFTTIVGMHELGYTDKRPRYKRLDRSLTAPAARAARLAACDELIRRVSALTTATPPLDIGSHATSAILINEPSPANSIAYKHREDLLDALLCAWTAAIWHVHGEARVQILGRFDAPDVAGHRPTIVAPARPEQRVEQRVGGRVGGRVARTPHA